MKQQSCDMLVSIIDIVSALSESYNAKLKTFP